LTAQGGGDWEGQPGKNGVLQSQRDKGERPGLARWEKKVERGGLKWFFCRDEEKGKGGGGKEEVDGAVAPVSRSAGRCRKLGGDQSQSSGEKKGGKYCLGK